jgi:hypothetical protein
MQKSIKKVIAGAVAALMITSSMPFVALAAPGDYEPDVQLQFSTFFDANEQSDPLDKTASSNDCYQSAVLCAYPLAYDEEAGTLKAKAKDINTYNEYYAEEWDPETDATDEDIEYGVGDIFAVTIRFDNVSKAALGNVNIRFSDNLAPAGLGSYTYKQGNKTKTGYAFFDEDNKPTGYKDSIVGFRDPVEEFSASSLYEGMNDTAVKDLSCIKEDPYAEDGDGWSDLMMTATLVCSGDYVDVSEIDGGDEGTGFFNIADGTYDAENGYTYPNQFVVVTFVLAITADGPIKFALQDPTGELDPKLDGAAFFADKSEGDSTTVATTYAINKFNPDTKAQDGETEWPGSAKMTFMGKNENKGEAPHEHSYTSVTTAPTCTEKGYTTYTCACGDEYVDDYVNALGHDLGAWTETTAAVAATCEAAGKTAVETRSCKRTGCTYSETRGGADVEAKGHAYAIASIDWDTLDTATGKVTANFVCANDSTHTTTEEVQTTFEVTQQQAEGQAELTTYTYAAGEFSDSKTVQTKEPGAHVHNYVPSVTAPTCTAQGYTTYTCACGDEYVDDYVNALGHDLGDWAVTTPAVPATCTEDGVEAVETRTCKREGCDYSETRGGAVVNATGHSLGDWAVTTPAVPATCTEDGAEAIETRSCANCDYSETRGGTVVKATGHALGDWAVTTPAVAPTKKDKGATAIETRNCANCDYSESRGGEEIDALGVTVTLNTSDIGFVEGLEAGANKLAYGTTVTLTATPVEGAEFVGWEIGGNIVSKEATYSTKAVSDITITPVFQDQAAETITVTFYDKYGNTVKQYKDVEVADYQAAIAAEFDSIVAPTYPSYTFKAWDKSEDEIKALDVSTTIWAIYDKVEETVVPKYTVTTTADIELPAGIVNGQIPYDTQVTVSDAAATAWKIGDAIVAYGTSYTFYVGSDVTIDPVYAEVEEAASVTVIGANLVAGSDYKYNIVATRNVPDSFTLVDYGFVYGKNLTEADIDLDNVGNKGSNANSGDVKAVHGGTRNSESNEFAFNYGIKAKNAPITAKAFVVVTDKNGETEIIYSELFTQNY